jgi:opacity protein-like surface antigen
MRLIFATTAAAVLLSAGAAAAEEPNWYVQGNAGAVFGSRLDADPANIKGKTGWDVSGAVGRDFGNGVRLESELVYLSADAKHGVAGKTETLGGFANAYYDFRRDTAWRPFVGAGIGLAQVKYSGDDDTGFAYQLKAGVAHPFTDRLTGEVAYRYLGVTGVEGSRAGVRSFDGDYRSSAVTVGLRYTFGR